MFQTDTASRFFQFSYLICLSVLVCSNDGHRKVIKDTGRGKIQGRVVDLGIQGLPTINQFFGVPYGRPPLRENRFMPPQGLPKWGHIKDGTKMRSACTQDFPDLSDERKSLKRMPTHRFQLLRNIFPFVQQHSEDCLYLNMYVPQVNDEELPVVVFIHGESYSFNTGNVYDGSVMAAYGRVIVVTLNYRLGPLGFLSTGFDDHRLVSGNFALTDIISAVEMLRVIVPKFGGSRDKISLMGAGVGAALVQLLMASPYSLASQEQKFQRAILLGGSALSSSAMVSTPNQYFYLFAQKIGCEVLHQPRVGQKEVKSPVQVFDCIKAQSVENITLALHAMPQSDYLSTFGPVVDGMMVPKDLDQHLKEHPEYFRKYDLLVGINEQEAYDHLPDEFVRNGMIKSERDMILRTLVRNSFSYHRSQIFNAVANEYTDWRHPQPEDKAYRDKLIDALTDFLYLAPLVKTAQLHSNNQAINGGTSTWMYVFQQRSNIKELTKTGDDIPFIFGYPLVNRSDPKVASPYLQRIFSPADRVVSEALMRYVANFVHSGDPNVPDSNAEPSIRNQYGEIAKRYQNQRWPKFAAHEGYIIIGSDPRSGQYYRADSVAFWNNFIPTMNKPSGATETEKHHFLPEHLNKARYIGSVYPHGGYLDLPPVPPPPTPPPAITSTLASIIDKKKKEKALANGTAKPGSSTSGTIDSTMLSITVAVGCAFLILNILVLAGIYHQRDKHKKERIKHPALMVGGTSSQQYNSYEPGVAPYINLSSPVSHQTPHMPPAPPPPGNHSQHVSFRENDLHNTPMRSVASTAASTSPTVGLRTFSTTAAGAAPPIAPKPQPPSEQEPLLSSRPNICPRHGRPSVRAPVQSGMDEVQV